MAHSHPIVKIPPQLCRPILAYGSSGMIGRDVENDQEVWKCPIRYDTHQCSPEGVAQAHEVESYSALCMDRERSIYQHHPLHENILQGLQISDIGIRLPYMQHGNIRAFCQTRCVTDQTKDQWIKAAIAAIAHLHSHGVIHADLSPRNFLVTDHLALKLCDFGGSGLQDLPSIAEEEDPYRIFPGTPRSFHTDVFALGCLIYEIAVGKKPYADIDDEDWEQIANNYAAGSFPRLDRVKYQHIIRHCWILQYDDAQDVLRDIGAMESPP
ncbi:kinase-like protein [Aspergillus aculeatinus CBS 121060]|uniref:Kinase-like protein n=1 Tax=Aspergillus aculeatinus CBS 121060 TaxID=1448322 RepID=A0ACD1GUT0_9EURO|nr:kinase-like protein [Aspergillus aculeatinus CBS 121060]RAH65219.1 kinase-like protein [Aspergillus aculeatinus CBS 121060]